MRDEKAAAAKRERRLVREVERVVESGEFTPHESFFFVDETLGPCGCAVAAADFLGIPLFGEERHDLEAGYEHYTGERRAYGGNPFYGAGIALRKFNPCTEYQP
jgi:hypothetical protein